MVSQAKRSIRRKDGKYFIYVPMRLVEDTAFPLKIGKHAAKIWIRFKRPLVYCKSTFLTCHFKKKF